MKTTFTIDRGKWRCGGDIEPRGHGHTMMLNPEGYMCCLGQIGRQLGCPDDQMLDFGEPCDCGVSVLYRDEYDEIDSKMAFPPEWKGILDGEFIHEAIAINDSEELTDTQRERSLERLAEQYGLRIDFIGDYT
jgi:hypothetical protein